MTAKNFDAVMDVIFRHEGGYVDHPSDPGGATNMGITIGTLSAWRGKRVSKSAVKALTKDEAGAIYRANYWTAIKGDELPDGFDLVAMDGAVNSGPSRGAKWLQAGLGVAADGQIGPITIKAAWDADARAINAAMDSRLSFLRGLRTWGTFGKGWQRRIDDTRAIANGMFQDSGGKANPPAPQPPASNPWAAFWASIVSAFRTAR